VDPGPRAQLAAALTPGSPRPECGGGPADSPRVRALGRAAVTFIPRRTAVVGATGPTGHALLDELRRRGRPVRAVSRNEGRLRELFGDHAEVVAADALDPEALTRAVDGCDLVVDCIGLPPERMADHPRTARSVAAAARAAGARILQVSSFWSFLPQQRTTLDESHPRTGGNRYVVWRRQAEDTLLEAGAAVVHLPDFFGPRVHTSTLQRPLEEAASGRPMSWIGRADVEREYAWVPDTMALTADLLGHDAAYGGSWVFPGGGPLTAHRVAEIAGQHLGRKVGIRAAPPALLRLLALVSKDLRAFLPMVPHYTVPVAYDASRLRGLLGEVTTTAYELAIPATLDRLGGAADRT